MITCGRCGRVGSTIDTISHMRWCLEYEFGVAHNEPPRIRGADMGKFSGVEDAKMTMGGVYFLAGKYIIEVVRAFTMRSRKKEDLFIVECEIVESNNEKRPPGSRASWVVNFKQDAALGNIKGFVGAANGLEDENDINEQVTEEVCEFVVSDDNPLGGTRLNLECTDTKTRAGGDFTLHRWSPLEA